MPKTPTKKTPTKKTPTKKTQTKKAPQEKIPTKEKAPKKAIFEVVEKLFETECYDFAEKYPKIGFVASVSEITTKKSSDTNFHNYLSRGVNNGKEHNLKFLVVKDIKTAKSKKGYECKFPFVGTLMANYSKKTDSMYYRLKTQDKNTITNIQQMQSRIESSFENNRKTLNEWVAKINQKRYLSICELADSFSRPYKSNDNGLDDFMYCGFDGEKEISENEITEVEFYVYLTRRLEKELENYLQNTLESSIEVGGYLSFQSIFCGHEYNKFNMCIHALRVLPNKEDVEKNDVEENDVGEDEEEEEIVPQKKRGRPKKK